MSIACHDIESSTEDKVAHDVVVEIRGPLRHVERLRPSFVASAALKDNIAESLYVLHKERLRSSQGFVRECMFHHSSVRCVYIAVGLSMYTICASRCCFDDCVPRRLSDIGLAVGINCSHGLKSIERQRVWADSDDGTLLWVSYAVQMARKGRRYGAHHVYHDLRADQDADRPSKSGRS